MIDWAEMTQAHGPLVWKVAYRLVGNESDASDCFQETFIAALEYSQGHRIDNWPGLLRRLATVQALQFLRQRRRRRARAETGDEVDELPSTGPGPEAITGMKESIDRLRHEVAGLPPLQGEVFCLHYFEGCSHEEIASERGIGIGHVRVLLHRARTALSQRSEWAVSTQTR